MLLTVKDIIISIDSEFDTISTNATCYTKDILQSSREIMDATDLLALDPEDFITESIQRFRDKKDSATGKIYITVDRVFCQQQLDIMVFDTGFSVFTDHNVFSYISTKYGGDGTLTTREF